MPIKIPNELPAAKVLTDENIFIMTETRAITQDIRALKILLLNLMPTKIDTETQLSRLLGNTALQIELELIHTRSHESKNTPEDHLLAFYKTFDEVKEQNWDGLIITGAPIEQMEFEEVEYWDELVEIMEWSKTHVYSTLHICWGAQAGLYYHYHIQKHLMKQKVFGIYPQTLCDEYNFLTNGFDEIHYTPHSRHTAIDEHALAKQEALEILSRSDVTGSNIVATGDFREIYILGHLEYGKETLAQEYFRDVEAGLDPDVPYNYFPHNDPQNTPRASWRSHGNLLFTNWLNYYVYQITPYDLRHMNPTLD